MVAKTLSGILLACGARVDRAPRDFALARPWISAPLGEYGKVLVVLAALTFASWFAPVSYHALGQIYLLAVIALSVRVSRGPALVAALVSAVAWNYVFIPPRLSFAVMSLDDDLLLGTYVIVALIGGQLTARIREQERAERRREQRATALFNLARALASARTLDDAARAAVQQADELFAARTALLFALEPRRLVAHPASTLALDDDDLSVADWTWHHGREAGRFTTTFPTLSGLHVPMRRTDTTHGVLVLRLADDAAPPNAAQRELMDAFAAQIALLIEREQLRAASDREKLLHESHRLQRTLLDSVSHELKTPLAVMRAAAEKVATADETKRGALAREIGTATNRLDHLVANLLNQTRLESGRLEAQLDWCDVRDLVAAARRAVGRALDGRAVTLELPDDMPLVMVDAALMEQVLTNLLLNAARHTPAGTPIAIRGGTDYATSRVFVSISDRGPGIPSELLDQLFQKFRRGADARAGGLGLGLSIVKGFMLAQSGGVTVLNNPDGGATFTIHLPHLQPERVPHDEH